MVDAIEAESVVCTHLVELNRVSSMRIKVEEAKHGKEHDEKGEEIGKMNQYLPLRNYARFYVVLYLHVLVSMNGI